MEWTADGIVAASTDRFLEAELAQCPGCGARHFLVYRVGTRQVLLYVCAHCEADYLYGPHGEDRSHEHL